MSSRRQNEIERVVKVKEIEKNKKGKLDEERKNSGHETNKLHILQLLNQVCFLFL